MHLQRASFKPSQKVSPIFYPEFTKEDLLGMRKMQFTLVLNE